MRAETSEETRSPTRVMSSALEKAGFRDLGAYFRARTRATFVVMSREMGVSGETVRRWYRDWSGVNSDCS